MSKLLTAFLLLLTTQLLAAGYTVSGVVYSGGGKQPIPNVEVAIEKTTYKTLTNEKGFFTIANLQPGSYKFTFKSLLFELKTLTLEIENSDIRLDSVDLKRSAKLLSEVLVEQKQDNFGVRRLKSVSEAAIYEGKKNEVLVISQLDANLATNCSRQIFAKVPGINIWESDAAGLQLGIATRGLDPNRTSNFNTRQNGYDMSADALGYPESYYVPPAEAVSEIEVVRGAASLQYGPQFGGMLNYVLQKAPVDKKIEWTSYTTAGAYKLVNTFNSLGGTIKCFKYYGFYNYKQGDSWRPNGGYKLHNAFASLGYQCSERLAINAEYTFSHYVAQQPGGLTDAQFNANPRIALRNRNWFATNWNILALTLNYKYSAFHILNIRTWGFMGSRNAVGFLGPANRVDDVSASRDLIKDKYRNFGVEARYVWKYFLSKNAVSSLLIGTRFYKGETQKAQGYGTNGSDADFSFTNDSLKSSDYLFPGTNFSLFGENVFNIGNKVKIVPGLRYEHISTKAQGYYRQVYNEIVDGLANSEQRRFSRNFMLVGLGISYNVWKNTELYSNFSQNYRGITFTDMRVVRISQLVDPNLRDETGFNIDLGYRGNINWFMYDVSGFWLQYNNRIGQIQVVDSLYNIYRYNTNVGRSRSLGVEAYLEADLLDAAKVSKRAGHLVLFVSTGFTNAKYTHSNYRNVTGKFLEFSPQLTLRGGITYRYKQFSTTVQASYTGCQFTDATNAKFTSTAVNGLIPAYYVVDWSAKYAIKCVQLSAGINNLTNNKYFTRRAISYPGPGIIPSEPLTFFVSLGIKLNEKVRETKFNTF